MRELVRLGVSRLVVTPGSVEPLPTDELDPNRWFQVPGPVAPVDAVESDRTLSARLDGTDEPALEAQRFLAELASLWFERPAIDRGVVVPVRAAAGSAEILAIVLPELAKSRMLDPVTIGEFFTVVDPIEGDDDGPLVRPFTAAAPEPLGELEPSLESARETLDSYDSMTAGQGTGAELERRLLAATTVGLADATRRAYLDGVVSSVARTTGAVSTSAKVTVTLTARTGTVPVTLRNETGAPIRVRVRFDSDKLEFRDGDSVEVTLTGETTRLDVRVRTLATGAFPLDIFVSSPDGRIELARARYTIRSTAVSGVGLVLSVGAGVFLFIWWGRHWRDARRSRRLMEPEALHMRRGDGGSSPG